MVEWGVEDECNLRWGYNRMREGGGGRADGAAWREGCAALWIGQPRSHCLEDRLERLLAGPGTRCSYIHYSLRLPQALSSPISSHLNHSLPTASLTTSNTLPTSPRSFPAASR